MKQLHVLAIAIFSVALWSNAFAQTDNEIKKNFNEAERLEALDDYIGAAELFELIVKAQPDNANFNFRLANAIIESKSHKDPLPYLEKAVRNVNQQKYRANYKGIYAPDLAWFEIAKEYHRTMQFDKALEAYNKCLAYTDPRNTPLVEELNNYISNCKSGLVLQRNPIKVRHIDFAPLQATEKYVHSPLFSPDEAVFIFTVSDKSKAEILTEEMESDYDDNIYTMKFVNGKWTNPQILSPQINSSRKEASIGISPDGKKLLIYRDDFGDGNLYYSNLDENGEWGKPKKFPSPINSSALESCASLSADGNTIYFTSDRSGGFGGMDIYMCKKNEKGKWGEAINLGAGINTKWHEESPHIQAYSNILYFCSNRPESMGGFDIFRCQLKEDNTVYNLVNLGYPINTSYNDLFFKTTVDGKKGYFSSNCKSSYGELDLNMIEFLDIKLFPNVTIKGLVIDQEGDTLKNSHVSLFNIQEKDITDSTTSSDKDGIFSFDLNSENKYFASFQHEGWVYFSKPFHIEKYFAKNTFSNLIMLDPIVLDDSSMRQNVSDFRIMRNDLHRRTTGEIDANDLTAGDELFEQITAQKEVAFSQGNANLNPLARKQKEKLMAGSYKKPESVIQKLERITDLDMPIANIVIPTEMPEEQYIDNKAIADSLQALGIKDYEQQRYTPAVENLELALNRYEDLGLIKDVVVTANYLALALSADGRFDEAIPPHLLALSLLRQLGDTKEISDKEYEVGIAYDNIYNKNNAVNYLSQSKTTRETLNDLDGQIQSVSGLVDVYERHSDYTNTILSLEELLRLTRQKGKKEDIAAVLNRLGLAYSSIEEFDKAMEYFNMSIAELEGLDDKKALSIYLNNIGNNLFAQEKYEEALAYYQRSLDIKREIGFKSGEALTLHNMGNSHYRLSDFDQSLELLSASMIISKSLDANNLIAQNHFSLMQVYRALGDYEKALSNYEDFISMRVPSYGKRDSQVAQEKAKYELSQKDIALLKRKMQKQELINQLELEKRNQEIALLSKKEERSKQLQHVIIGIGIGLLAILFLFIRRLRSKQKLNAELQARQELILCQKDRILNQKSELETIHVQLEKLSIVASKTGNAVSIFDHDGNFEWVNNAFTAIYGKKVAELNTKDSMSIFNVHSDKLSIELIEESLKRKEATNFEALKQIASGAHIWMNSSVTPIFSEDELLKIIVIDSDVNEQKEKEREIKLQRDEIARQRDEIESQRDVALKQKDEIEKQAITLQDTINELQSTQKKLIEAEKMASLGNLVAGVAHEINTPVGIGIAAASSFKTKTATLNGLFESKKMKQSDLVQYLQSAKEATNLLKANLTRTGELVKSFKQVSVDEITEQCREFNFKEYLQDVLNSLDPKLREKYVEIAIQCNDDIILNSYPGAYAQILTNFVTNSITHGFAKTDNGKITISASTTGNEFSLSFADDGAGMTEESVQRCFDPFYTTNMQQGTGLGLNIVYNLVSQKLKGDILCKSELGKGATFRITVPTSLS